MLFALIAALVLPALCLGDKRFIRLREEVRDGRRFLGMDEIEEKAKFYLRRYKGITDKDQVNDKIKVMSDRLIDLYRLVGLDEIHLAFADQATLDLTLGDDEDWNAYMIRRQDENKPSNFLLYLGVGGASAFIAAVVLASPFSWKYGKMMLKGCSKRPDSEWCGAENGNIVKILRRKKKTKRLFYKPAPPSFDLNCETGANDPDKLEEIKENMRQKIKEEDEECSQYVENMKKLYKKVRKEMREYEFPTEEEEVNRNKRKVKTFVAVKKLVGMKKRKTR